MRQTPNLRYTARGRPQILQRRTSRVENFGSRCDIATFDLLATFHSAFMLKNRLDIVPKGPLSAGKLP
jgi:hypothetical protein